MNHTLIIKGVIMKFIKILLSTVVLLVSFGSIAAYVSGYTKSNGTYVQPYYRSDRNSTVKDNYSYSGNTNPYTSKVGTNKYYDSPSSDYYKPSSGLGTFGTSNSIFGR
jgi:hypothetical protein